MGTKLIRKVPILGIAIPSRRTGQAAAAPTSAERSVCSRLFVRPNSATTAQPKIDDVIRPSERVISAKSA
jgi:hypothetical protein